MTTTIKPKRPQGRPALPPGDGKTARMELRVSEDTKARAHRAAAASGQSVSQLFTALLDNRKP